MKPTGMKKALSHYKLPIIIALIQWFITTVFQFDRAIFTYEAETGKTLAVKLIYLLFLLAAWCFGFHVRDEIKNFNLAYQRGLQVFVVYFSFMMLILLFLWPGTWSWDDIAILRGILEYTSFVEWQHFLSGLYQAVLLQVIPHPGGVILIQNAIISVCVAFCVVKLETCFGIRRIKNVYVDLLIKLLPFLTFPVLMYQFSGYRMGLYVYLELTMLVIVICGIRENSEWSWKYILLLAFLVSIVASWRTESLFYVIFISLALVFLGKKVLSRKKKIVAIVIIFLAFLCLNRIQNSYLVDSDYKLASLMGPYAAVIKAGDTEADKENLEIIGKVIDVDMVLADPDARGTDLFWGGAYHSDYTQEEFSDALKALISMSIKYPSAVLEERWGVFKRATGITCESWMINWRNISLFRGDDLSSNDEYFQEKGYYPPFTRLRARMINYLSCYNAGGECIEWLRLIVWNAWIPMIVLVAAWFGYLFKRKWYNLLLCTAVVIRIPVVFLTEPSGWIMYLLSFYFLGYMYLVYEIVISRQRAGK